MEDVQATARWANRVLRPLTSIYRRIEKYQAEWPTVAIETNLREAAKRNGAYSTALLNSRGSAAKRLESDADPEGNDPAWIPGTTVERRRARHKYTSRAERNGETTRNRLSIHSPEASRTLPGAIEVATPLITGKTWEMPSSSQSNRSTGPTNNYIHPPPAPDFDSRCSRYKSPWQELLDQTGDAGLISIANNLDRVLQNFLFSTRKSKREPIYAKNIGARRGARSLMSMVVRRLPDFIAKEQEAQDALDEDGDEDMCDAYFTELEAFYAPHGTGWDPLREAVRAQGVNLVARMIQNNWITDTMVHGLIEKCRAVAPEESDLLLSASLATRGVQPYPQDLKPADAIGYPGDPIRLLRKYAQHGVVGRAYIFDELAKLLLRGVLPPEWMGTKLWTIWMTRATVSFSKDDTDSPAASRLIEAVILSASGIRFAVTTPAISQKPGQKGSVKEKAARPTRAASNAALEGLYNRRRCPIQVEDALSNHIISLMAALCGIHISRSRVSDGNDTTTGTKAGHMIRYLEFALQQDLDSRTRTHQIDISPHQLLRRGCILLATSLELCNDAILLHTSMSTIASTTSIDACAQAIVSRPDMIKELALFVQQALRCLRATPTDEPEHTSKESRLMISRLASSAETPGISTLLGLVAAETAMEFAEATADPDDHVWAVEVQESVAARQTREENDQEHSEEPANSSQKNSLFRWEESIGEWVAPTPAAKKKLHIAPRVEIPMRMLSDSLPCISYPTDRSTPASDRESASSTTSSPTSMPNKRTFEDVDVSHSPPSKRLRPAPVVVLGAKKASVEATSPISARGHPTVETVTRREILRERSTNLARNTFPVTRQAPKVVIINAQRQPSSQETVRSYPGQAVRRVHRTMERKRPARPSVPVVSRTSRRHSSEQMVLRSQDSNSDDELSFL